LYLSLVDHIGSCFFGGRVEARFKTTLLWHDKEPSASQSLTQIGALDDSHVELLYGLRCALVHDYSPTNVADNCRFQAFQLTWNRHTSKRDR